jgi:hypothetical protein
MAGSIKELKFLIDTIQDRMEQIPICSPRFKGMLIVSRRLCRTLKGYQNAIKHRLPE